ncbi:MAG: ABC transporter ATP-binding protein [Opitutaceae bacterium]
MTGTPAKKTGTLHRFRPYLRYLRGVRSIIALALLCGLIYGVANGAGLPLMAKYVFPRIFPQEIVAKGDDASGFKMDFPGTAAVPAQKSTVSGDESPPKDPREVAAWEVFLAAIWLPLIFLVRGLAGYLNTYLIQLAGVRVLESLRLDFFRKLQVLPLAFFQNKSSGDLISRGLADTNQLQVTLTTVANEVFKQPITLVSSISVLVYLTLAERGVGLVLVSLAVVPLCVLPIRFVGNKLDKRAANLQKQLGSVTDRMSENLAVAREVRAFSLEEYETNRFATVTEALIRAQMKVVKYATALTPAIEIISAVGISVTFVYAFKAQVPLGSFLAIIFALYACYEPIKKLGNLNSELKRGLAALDRLEVVLEEPVTIRDPENPVAIERLRGTLDFRDVTFSYNSDGAALREVNVTIPTGMVCALVGPSGAGKTTFANLVPRFYDATTGSVEIDGIDIRTMRLADLRRNIALVPQDPVLFNETIGMNLRIGKPEASQEEVEAASRAAFAHEFIVKLPNGYDTVVGERGVMLSGGQKQRLAVGRAFLRNAPILILDEATSALDSESEEKIQTALKELMQGKTVLIIAHRFSTIRDAGQILVFDNGRITARGSHEELMGTSPLYRNLYERQAQP